METDLSRILESRQALTDAHVKYFVYQILRGMKYLVRGPIGFTVIVDVSRLTHMASAWLLLGCSVRP